MSVLALVPARSGSKGIPEKNFRRLADGASAFGRALDCAKRAGCVPVITSDHPDIAVFHAPPHQHAIARPPELAQDDTPMIDVVKHALGEIPGPSDQIIVVLQPTQPLRTPEHIQQAIALLQESQADSVASVVQLPLTHSPDLVWCVHDGNAESWLAWYDWLDRDECICEPACQDHGPFRRRPMHRQDARPAYIRDGTVYAFWRKTVAQHGTIYGQDVRPLIIQPEETCPLDTEADWQEAERRLRARAQP